jgi:hypothetical protein
MLFAAHHCWPDATLVRPLSSILGHRFDEIIMLWHPFMGRSEVEREAGQRWLDEALRCRLKPGGEMVWLV